MDTNIEDAQKLHEMEFQLRCARYQLAEETKEKEKFKAKYQEASILERRTKKENKELKATVDELTATHHNLQIERDNAAKTSRVVQTKLEALEPYLAEAKKENKELKATIDELTATHRNLQIERDNAAKKSKVVQTKLEALEPRLAEAKNDLIVYKTELVSTDKDYKDALKALDEMREYANLAVTEVNNAWRDGADTMEFLRAELRTAADTIESLRAQLRTAAVKELDVKKWCADIGGSSTMVSDSEAWKVSDTCASSSVEFVLESESSE